MTLTDFLLARIAEDEAVAQAATADGGEWHARDPKFPEYHMYGDFGWVVSGPDVEVDDSEWGKSVADHIARHDPARVLADCKAKRRIVDVAKFAPEGSAGWGFRRILRLLAQSYADHEDYRDEWKP